MERKNRAKTVARYVTPTILSTVSVFFYTIVDGIFVGRGVGGYALGAINIAFPFVMFFSAVTMLTTIGGLTITAIRIGREDTAGASQVFLHSLTLTVGFSLIMSLTGIFLARPVCRFLGAGNTFIDMASEYLFYYSLFLVPCGICANLQGFCRNDGAPVLVSASTIIGTALNILGDYIALFPLHMGVKGAAIATGLAQIVSLLIVSVHYIMRDGVLRFRRVPVDMQLIGRMFVRGTPECISQFAVPVSIMMTNWVLRDLLGDAAVNAFAVIGYAASFAVAVFVGTAEGIQPLLGNSYGAGDEEGLRYYFRTGLKISIIGSVFLSVVILFLWDPICTAFAVDEATRECAAFAIWRYIPGFTVQAATVIITSYLYSTTRTRQAVIINLLRSFIAVIPVILLVPRIFGADTVWSTFWIYEGIALIAAVIIVKKADRNGAVGHAME